MHMDVAEECLARGRPIGAGLRCASAGQEKTGREHEESCAASSLGMGSAGVRLIQIHDRRLLSPLPTAGIYGTPG